jgi:hypothetical protein
VGLNFRQAKIFHFENGFNSTARFDPVADEVSLSRESTLASSGAVRIAANAIPEHRALVTRRIMNLESGRLKHACLLIQFLFGMTARSMY